MSYKHSRRVALTPQQKKRLSSQLMAGKPAMLSLGAHQLGSGDAMYLTKGQALAVDAGAPVKWKLSKAQLQFNMDTSQTGGGIFDDIGSWITTAAEDTGKAFKSAANDVGTAFLDVVTDPEVKAVLRPLLVAGAGAGASALATAAGQPALSGMAGAAGSKSADVFLRQLGYGLRPMAGGALGDNPYDSVGLDMSPAQFDKLMVVLEANMDFLTA